MPRPGRSWFVVAAYAALLAIVGVGLLYGDRLDRRLAGVHTLVEHRRVGAAVDDYYAGFPKYRPRGEGGVMAVASVVFLTGIGATLALVGLFFVIVGLAQTLR